jgi:hypothetical protein
VTLSLWRIQNDEALEPARPRPDELRQSFVVVNCAPGSTLELKVDAAQKRVYY